MGRKTRVSAMVAVIGILAAGCATVSDYGPASEAPSEDLVPAPTSFEQKDTDMLLALTGPNGQLRVGDTQDMSEKVFPVPPNAFTVHDLPDRFVPPYRARGFETPREGFATLLYGDKVALAVRRLEDVTSEVWNRIVDGYREQYNSPTAEPSNGQVSYWFWSRSGQRLMICVTPDITHEGKFDVTEALGDIAPMDALRMNATSAYDDSAIGQRMIQGLRATKAKKKR